MRRHELAILAAVVLYAALYVMHYAATGHVWFHAYFNEVGDRWERAEEKNNQKNH
jgi:hypothetical protein